MDNKDSIQIFITGGTFHKTYDGVYQKFIFKSSYVDKILKDGRSRLSIKTEKLMMKDSLDITEDDISVIIDRCNNSPSDKIIIIHGTDMMCQHADIINKKINKNKNKTIILTGSIIPYKCYNSDASFNLSCALAFIQNLDKGIYIVMNGLCHEYNKVRKNYNTGFFEFT